MDLNAVMRYALKVSEQSSNNIEAQFSANKSINSPEEMMKLQYAFHQYSALVGCTSSVMKSIRDVVSSIIAKL